MSSDEPDPWGEVVASIMREIWKLTPDIPAEARWRADFVFGTTTQDVMAAVEDGIDAWLATQMAPTDPN